MLAMPEINHIKKLRNNKSLSINGLCQVILGLVIIPIFQTLKNCTLFATALRLLAGSSNKVLKARTLLDDPVVKVLAN